MQKSSRRQFTVAWWKNQAKKNFLIVHGFVRLEKEKRGKKWKFVLKFDDEMIIAKEVEPWLKTETMANIWGNRLEGVKVGEFRLKDPIPKNFITTQVD